MVANAQSVTQGLEQKEEKRPRAFEKKNKEPNFKGCQVIQDRAPPLLPSCLLAFRLRTFSMVDKHSNHSVTSLVQDRLVHPLSEIEHR